MQLLNLTIPQKNISDAEIGQNFHNNVGGRVTFEDIKNIKNLKKSIIEMVNLEDCFKIRVVNKDGKLFQYFDYSYVFKENNIKVMNFESFKDYHTWEKRQFSQHIFRENQPLFKIYICEVSGKFILFFLTSHFITDGYSLIVNLLNKLLTDNKLSINNYEDYVENEKEYLNSRRYKIDTEYWSNSVYNRKIFSFLDEPKTIRKFDSGSMLFEIKQNLSDKIVSYCKNKNVTVLEFWLLVLTLFLGEDKAITSNHNTYLSIGTPFMNRYSRKQRNTSGMFVNVLPFIIKPDINYDIEEYIQIIKKKSFELIKHGRVSNLEIQKKYMTLNNENTNLLGVMLNYIQTKKTQKSIYGKYHMYWPENEHNVNPLTINIVNFDKINNFNLKMDYQRAYFNKRSIKALFDGMVEIVQLLIEDRIKTISDVPSEKYIFFRKEVNNYIDYLTSNTSKLTKNEMDLIESGNKKEWLCCICKVPKKISESHLLTAINKVIERYPQINQTFNFLGNRTCKLQSEYNNFFYDKLTYEETIRQINNLDVNSKIDLGSEPLIRIISFEKRSEQYICIELHKLAGNLSLLYEINRFLIGYGENKITWLSAADIEKNTIDDIEKSMNLDASDPAVIAHTTASGKGGEISYVTENIKFDNETFFDAAQKAYHSFALTLSKFSDNKVTKVDFNNEGTILTTSKSFNNNIQFQDAFTKGNKSKYGFSAYEINYNQPIPTLFEVNDKDISVVFGYSGNKGTISFIYNPTYFSNTFIEHFKKYFLGIFELIRKNKFAEIKAFNPDKEIIRKNHKKKSNYTFEFVDKFLTINAEKFPNKIAARDENKAITYKELNVVSDKLANYLVNNTNSKFVGVCMDRSINTIISFYSILKAGKTYVPIDPAYPESRINYIIEDAKIEEILTDKTTNRSFLSKNINKLDLVQVIGATKKVDSDSLKGIKRVPEDAAYVIYTSGTTGKPKGVVNIHKSLTNTIYSFVKLLGITSQDKFLFKTSFGFDMSLLEIVAPIVTGGTVVVAKNGGEQDPEYIEQLLREHKPTAVFFTPSLLRTYLDNNNNDSLNNLRIIYFAAEPLSGSTLIRLQKFFKGKIFDLYGPTEACILCIGKEHKDKFNERKVIKIGKPFPNVNVHILNKEGIEQPIGCIGEICLSGYNLANGYLNKKELTERAFKYEETIDGDKLVYHSGDLGRIYDNGEIECFGRTDDQVKVRGNRVELDEVNKNIMQYHGVSNAYSIIKKDAYENNYIASAFVSPKKIDTEKIRIRLREFLPKSYMPTILVQVDKIPSNFNGKVDKSRLAKKIDEEVNKSSKDSKIENQSANETKLYEIVKSILNLKSVDSDQDFFEIGGNSLAVTYLVNKIQEIYKVEISLQDVYIHSKLKDLLTFVEQKVKSKKTGLSSISLVLKDAGKFKMSSNQRRMYLIQKSSPESTAYNVARYLKIPKRYPMDNLKETLDQISLKQAAFRTTFQLENNNFYQIVHKRSHFDLSVSISKEDFSEKELSNMLSEYVKPFNLDKGPLFRVKMIEGINYNYLLFDMHHIIVDGESMRVLLDELLSGILNKEISSPKIQYVDFSDWFDKQDLKPEIDYWSSRQVNTTQAEILPNKISQNNSVQMAGYIQKEIKLENVEEVAQKLGISVYSMFLSFYFIALYRYIDQGEITIASPVSGRIRYETNDLIGMFVNTILINSNINQNDTLIDLMKKVNYIANDSISNQSLPYEDIIRYFSKQIKYDLTRSISFFYSLSDDFKIYSDLNTMDARFGKCLTRQTQFPLSLEIIKRPNGYYEELTYAKNFFNESFAKKIVEDINCLSLYASQHPLDTIHKAISKLN